MKTAELTGPAQQALNALDQAAKLIHHTYTGTRPAMDAMTVAIDAAHDAAEALRAELEQPQAEPVAWVWESTNPHYPKQVHFHGKPNITEKWIDDWTVTPLYAAPQSPQETAEQRKHRALYEAIMAAHAEFVKDQE